MIRTLIIEDEPKSLAVLINQLKDYCQDVKVVGTAGSVEEGIAALEQIQPELLFLDIAMPDGDGFDVLERSRYRDFSIIFTTAFEEYAIRAFDFSAMQYLLKPISPDDLMKSVNQFLERRNRQGEEQMNVLKESLRLQFNRLALPTLNGIEFVKLEEIYRCEADGAYTRFFLTDKRMIVVSRSLSHFEKLLKDTLFFRVHHKHLINLRYVQRYVRGSGGYVVMESGAHIDVSVRRKDRFLKLMSKLTGM
jgi:two-component system LytT family response regulator